MLSESLSTWLNRLRRRILGARPNRRTVRPALGLERLETRDCPSTFNPADILISTENSIKEFRTDGSLVQTIPIPYPGNSGNGRPARGDDALGLTAGPNGTAYVINGYDNPYLSAYDSTAGTWTHTTTPNWSLSGVTFLGSLGHYQQYVYAPSWLNNGNFTMGIVRFNTADGTVGRYDANNGYDDVNVGLDGLVYAVRGDDSIQVYDPNTMRVLKSQGFSGTLNILGVTADAAGNMFVASADGSIYKMDPNFTQLSHMPLPMAFLTAIDIRNDGTLVVASAFGSIFVTDTSFSGYTPFSSNSSNSESFVAFADPTRSPPTITSGNSATFTVGTAGSFQVTDVADPAPTFSVAGALPAGVTLNPATGLLSGTPAAGSGGAYHLTLTANNSVGTAASQKFTLNVDESPGLASADHATFLPNRGNTFTVETTGFPKPALAETGTLPGGISFIDNGDGTATISGIPDAADSGPYAFTITAHNGLGSDATQSFTLTIDQGAALTTGTTATFAVGSPGSVTFQTTGVPVPSLSESGKLPAGVTFTDNGDGTAVLAGTPNTGTGAAYPLTITAHNGVGRDAVQSFLLNVDEPAGITGANALTLLVGSAGSLTVQTTGFPKPTLSESGPLPTGVTFDPGTGILDGTPVAGTVGTYHISIAAHNTSGADAALSITLTVNQRPALTSAAATSFAAGSAGSFTVQATGFPLPALGVSGTLPAGVTFTDNGDGTATLTGTPAVGTGASYPLTITAHNGAGADASQSFTLAIDEAPSLTGVNPTTLIVGSTGGLTVQASGFPTPTLHVTGTLPAGVSFTDKGDGTGSFAGIPLAGSQGVYPVTVTAHNASGADASAPLTLTVDLAPSFTSTVSTPFVTGSSGTVTIAAAGYPAPTLSEQGTLPAGVTFTANADGTASLAGLPQDGTGGSYPVTFTAHNGVGADVTQSFTLLVNQASAITTGNSATFIGGNSGAFTFRATGYPTPALSAHGMLPSGITLTDHGDGTATVASTPTANASGPYTFTLLAHNSVGADATQPFTLTVDQPATLAGTGETTFITGALGSLTIHAAGFPVPQLGISGTLPDGVKFTDHGDGSATLAGIPSATAAGNFALTVTAYNGIGSDATQALALTVNAPAAITSAAATTFTTGVSGSLTITTAGFPVTALSAFGALPAGVKFIDNGNGTATLAGTPLGNTGGSYHVSVAAHNGIGADATQDFVVTVAQHAAITSASQTTFTAGTPGTLTIQTTGFPVATLSDGGATLPAGLTFTDHGDGTATLAGTPGAGTGGTVTLALTAHNGIGADATQTLMLTIREAPAITSAGADAFTVGHLGSFTVTTAHHFPTAVSLDASGTLPTGVSFTDDGDGTATLAGMPSPGSAGAYPLTITARNGTTDVSQSFTLTVGLQAQTIAFASLAGRTYGATAFALNATASSGLPVAFQVISGPATIAGSTLTLTGAGTVTVQAAQPGDGTFSAAAPVTQSFAVAKALLTVTADNLTRLYGQANPTLTYTISGFVKPDSAATAHLIGAPALSVAAPAASPVGSYPIVLDVSGLSAANYTFAATGGTLTINKAVLTVTANTVSFVYGTPNPPFSATITGFQNGETLATSGVTGAPSFTTDYTPSSPAGGPGYHFVPAQGSLTARNYDFTTFTPGLLTVSQASSSVSLQSTGSPSGLGQPVTITATVSAVSPSTGVPTGSVTLDDGTSNPLSTTLVGGVATFTLTDLPVGTHALSVQYYGDDNFTGSTAPAPLTQAVLQASKITLTDSSSASVFGQPVTLTATVAPVGATTKLGGTVTFYDGTTPLGTVTLTNGKAAWTTSVLGATIHQLSAVYNGGSAYGPSQSTTLASTIGVATTSVTLTTSAPSAVVGQPLTFTAHVSPRAPSTTAPTGQVTFTDGAMPLLTVAVINGVASLPGELLSVGKHALSVSFTDTAGNEGNSKSAIVNETINPDTTAVVFTPTSPAVLGQPVTLTAHVNVSVPGSASPTGTVTFRSGTVVLGSAQVLGGVASWTTTLLPVGTDTITASYAGDANTKASIGTGRQTVGRDVTTLDLSQTSSIGKVGQSLTLTAQVSVLALGTAIPSGTVTFTEGRTVLGTAIVTNGVAKLVLKKPTAGIHALKASYSGDARCAGSTATLTVTISA